MDDLPDFPARRLHALARRLLGERAAADDVVQDAWLRWHDADRPALRSGEAWLTTVVRHLAIDRRRALALHADRLALAVAPASAPAAEDVAAATQDVQDALERVAERLLPHEAALVLLHEVFEADHAELAAAWGRGEAASRQALRRALQRLRADKAARRPNDEPTQAALLALCQGALLSRSAAPLFALLRERAIRAAVATACPPPAAGARPPATAALVQAGGTLAQVLVIAGVVVCVLPLGVRGEGEFALVA